MLLVKRPTCKRLEYLIEDEKEATAEYKKYGFKKLSNDESRHRKYLKKIFDRYCKK